MTTWLTRPDETPIDPSGLKIKGITTRAELNAAEGLSMGRAVVKYLHAKPTRRQAPFDLRWSKRLHAEMFGQVWEWAGEFRTIDLNIGVKWQHLETALYSLLEDLKSWSGYGVSLTEQAVRLHHRAVHLHPFRNGNGRWSRLLANIWLKLHGQPITEWPDETLGSDSLIRNEYIDAIKKADDGDYGPLLELQHRYTPAE